MLYFVQNVRRKAIKIGYSSEVPKRIRSLQTSSPDRLYLLGICPGDFADEAALHKKMDADRIRGEWFRESPELLALIVERCAGHRLWGRCSKCGEPGRELCEDVAMDFFICVECTSPSVLRTSKQRPNPATMIPAGGGYRIVRKGPR